MLSPDRIRRAAVPSPTRRGNLYGARPGTQAAPRRGRASRSMSVEFCDTNVIVYAYDTSAGAKHGLARQLLERLWREGVGAVSVQVLQELFVTLTRKIARPLDTPVARGIVADLATWHVVTPRPS